MYYKIASISYCFPYDISRCLYSDMFLDKKMLEKNSEFYGVFKPYIGKKMTEIEADKLLAEIIMKHPYMEGGNEFKDYSRLSQYKRALY